MIVNLDCTIGHDAVIGDFVTVAPSVNVSGAVRIGEGCDLGTGASIIQGIEIGEWSVRRRRLGGRPRRAAERHGGRGAGEADQGTTRGLARGRFVTDPIPMSSPDLDESDEAAVLEALRSGVLGLGPFAERFERAAAEVAGVEHGVAVSARARRRCI